MTFLNSKVSALMQYKCEYLTTINIYKRAGLTHYQPPDISDLDLPETKEFLMYVPTPPVVASSTAPLFLDAIVKRAGYTSFDWAINCDVYNCDSFSFGGTTITGLGNVCAKNPIITRLMLTVLAYELYARLDSAKHFSGNINESSATYAIEYLVCIKVCAQIMCGLLCIFNENNEATMQKLYTLCQQILAPDFYPDTKHEAYKYVFEIAQKLRLQDYLKHALVTDINVPIDMITFKINRHAAQQPDSVDMFSFYIFDKRFLEFVCNNLNIHYASHTDSQISFNVTFSDGLRSQTNILKHTIKSTN
jgi:hypothetical protein